MTYEDIIRSSVKAEFDAYCDDRPYCRLPKGHPVYEHGMMDREQSDLVRAIRCIAYKVPA